MLTMTKRRTNASGGGRKSDNDTDPDVFSAEEIEELVGDMANRSNSKKDSKAGGTSREKYTCKCCGTRVDSGVHKCSRCIEAGCAYGEKKCKFY